MSITRKQRTYQYLLRRLLDGTFSPNQRLFPALLAKEIGVSPIPVREAISQLQSEGLVVQKPRGGVFVRQTARQELVELIELRQVLECHAAAQAARRITAGALKELEAHLQELHRHYQWCASPQSEEERLPAMRAWMFADLNFHLALLRAARNQAVIKTLTEANVLTRMFGHRTDLPAVWKDSAFVDANFAVHRELFEAVARHDAQAARRAMALHMRRARKNILARFDWLQQERAVGSEPSQDFPESMRQILADVQRQHSDAPSEDAE